MPGQRADERGCWEQRLSGWLLLATAALVPLLIQALGFHPTWSDENIHLYVASRVADGASLYGDLRSARPPLAIWSPALLIRLGLSPLLAGRVLSGISVLGTATLVYALGRRLGGARVALFAALIFLLAPAVAVRTAFTGMNLVALGSLACLAASLAGRGALGGLLGGLALLTGQHAAVIVAVSWAGLAARCRREALVFLVVFVTTIGVAIGGAWLAGGHHVYQDLVGHHLYHLHGDDGGSSDLGWWLVSWGLENFPLLVLACCAPLLFGRATQQEGRGEPALPRPKWLLRPWPFLALVCVCHVGAVVGMKGGLILYLVPAVPLLALLAGLALSRLSSASLVVGQRGLVGALLLVLAVGTLCGWAAATERFGRRDEEPYPLVPQARYFDMWRLSEPRVAGRLVEHLAQSGGDGPIFGYPTITGLVALGSGRRVAGDQLDFAPRWFVQGSLSRSAVVARAEADGVEWFLTPNVFFLRDHFFEGYLRACYAEPVVFPREHGSGVPRMFLFERERDSGACAGWLEDMARTPARDGA